MKIYRSEKDKIIIVCDSEMFRYERLNKSVVEIISIKMICILVLK